MKAVYLWVLPVRSCDSRADVTKGRWCLQVKEVLSKWGSGGNTWIRFRRCLSLLGSNVRRASVLPNLVTARSGATISSRRLSSVVWTRAVCTIFKIPLLAVFYSVTLARPINNTPSIWSSSCLLWASVFANCLPLFGTTLFGMRQATKRVETLEQCEGHGSQKVGKRYLCAVL